MLIAALFGVHALILVCWAWRIVRGKSRLHFSHIFFAACLPFVGELCLLICECTSLPARPPYKSPFIREFSQWAEADWTVPKNWTEILLGSEEDAREFLLQVVRYHPTERIQIYQAGLSSESSEICHICAAALQKEHDAYEDDISYAAHDLTERPGNEQLAAAMLTALRRYRNSGLPDSASALALSARERQLMRNWPALAAQQEDVE